MKYSIIIPVYNRPDEVAELLESLCTQTADDFEVIVVEDGSQVPCRSVCERYASAGAAPFPLHYYSKANGGPGEARNYGAAHAQGDFLIVLDSDVVLPPGYIAAINAELAAEACDAFGGPDRAHPDFTPVQKAISYAMTSFFTTGGIRGGAPGARRGGRRLDRFYPRSFNMGVERGLWERLGGFRRMRFGEDIDFSYRICEAGARCRLFPEAWVWHKRRTDFRRFFRQVRNSGAARINLHLLHPGTMKVVHALPAVFTVGCAVLLGMVLAGAGMMMGGLLPLVAYALLIFVDAGVRNRSVWVGLLAVPASFIQLIGYGTGFLSAAWKRLVLKRKEEGFDDNKRLYS